MSNTSGARSAPTRPIAFPRFAIARDLDCRRANAGRDANEKRVIVILRASIYLKTRFFPFSNAQNSARYARRCATLFPRRDACRGHTCELNPLALARAARTRSLRGSRSCINVRDEVFASSRALAAIPVTDIIKQLTSSDPNRSPSIYFARRGKLISSSWKKILAILLSSRYSTISSPGAFTFSTRCSLFI